MQVLTFSSGGAASYRGPLTIEPAQPALADIGVIGGCSGFCSKYPGSQWVLSKSPSDCICFSDLAGLKVTLNYSSTDYIIDYYDFEPHPTPSSSSIATKKSTTISSRSTTSSATKSTSKFSFQTTPKTTTKPTSSRTSTIKKKKSSTKTSSKATSSKSTLHTSTSTLNTSSSKSTTHSTTKST